MSFLSKVLSNCIQIVEYLKYFESFSCYSAPEHVCMHQLWLQYHSRHAKRLRACDNYLCHGSSASRRVTDGTALCRSLVTVYLYLLHDLLSISLHTLMEPHRLKTTLQNATMFRVLCTAHAQSLTKPACL